MIFFLEHELKSEAFDWTTVSLALKLTNQTHEICL